MQIIDTTLVFLRDPAGRVLLGKKQRGFGAGKYNGFGGKIRVGEDAIRCAIREVAEECGATLAPEDLRGVAHCTFYFENGLTIRNCVYIAKRWTGEVSESEEMAGFLWCAPDALPLPEMWQDDVLWLPRVLAGEKLRAEFWFAGDGESVARHHIEALHEI